MGVLDVGIGARGGAAMAGQVRRQRRVALAALDQDAVGHVEAVLGGEGGPLGQVQRAQAGAGGLGGLLVVPGLLLPDGGDVVHEADDVGVLDHHLGGALVQAQAVAVVAVALGIGEALDLLVRQHDHRHAALVAKRADPAEEVAPVGIELDVALAVARVLDRGPLVALADGRPEHRLEPVQAVENHRPELVVAGQQELDRLVDLGRAGERAVREGGELEVAGALLGLDEDRVGELGGEAGLADAGHAVDDDPRRFVRLGPDQARKRQRHAHSSSCRRRPVGVCPDLHRREIRSYRRRGLPAPAAGISVMTRPGWQASASLRFRR